MSRTATVVAAIAVAFAASSARAIEEKDFIAYWSFDAMTGGNFKDDSGNGYDLAPIDGNVSLANGKFGKGALIVNSACQLAVPGVPIADPIAASGEMTMEAWVYLNSHANYDGIISIEIEGGDCCEYRALINPGFNPFWNMGRHVDHSFAGFAFQTDTWHHYVIAGDGDNAYIYVDGELINTFPEAFKLVGGKGNVFIGAGESAGVHRVEDAIIDEAAIYSKALSLDEIKTNMTKGIKGALAVQPNGKLGASWGMLKARP